MHAAVADEAPVVDLRQLSRQTYEALRAMIFRGEFAPGQTLVPRDLARSIGTSITPVRDAINQLAMDGLVAVSPRRGTVVRTFSETDVAELYQIRLMIEPAAAALAAESLTEDERRALCGLVERIPTRENAPRDVDGFFAFVRADYDFHAAVVRGARNQRLDAIIRGVFGNLIVVRTVIVPRSFDTSPLRRGQGVHVEHAAMLDALIHRAAAEAQQLMVAHLQAARDDLLAYMRTHAAAASQV